MSPAGTGASKFYRRAEVLRGGEWVPTEFESVRKGEVFRLFEPDGSPVVGRGGGTVFRALSKPRRVPPRGNWMIAVEEVEPEGE